jgi:hypothetical protein
MPFPTANDIRFFDTSFFIEFRLKWIDTPFTPIWGRCYNLENFYPKVQTLITTIYVKNNHMHDRFSRKSAIVSPKSGKNRQKL